MNMEVLKKIGVAMLVAGIAAAAQEGIKHLSEIKVEIVLPDDKKE